MAWHILISLTQMFGLSNALKCMFGKSQVFRNIVVFTLRETFSFYFREILSQAIWKEFVVSFDKFITLALIKCILFTAHLKTWVRAMRASAG